MKMRDLVSLRRAVVAAAVLVAAQASAIIAYQNAAGNYGNSSANRVLGMAFSPNVPLEVTALGAFDNGQNGWASPVTVAIYNLTTASIVGPSVTFSGTSGAHEGTLVSGGGSRFLSVAPFYLTAGTAYMVVAAGYGTGGLERNYTYSGFAANPHSTISGDISPLANFYASGTTMTLPTTFDFGANPKYAAGTFAFTVVPEAATFGAAGVGLLGLVYIGRYARLRRNMKFA